MKCEICGAKMEWSEVHFAQAPSASEGYICLCEAAHPTIAALRLERDTLKRELEEARSLQARLKQEAEIQAQEARTHRATVHECYQIVTGGEGEPGNWNGAAPVRDAFRQLARERDAAQARVKELEALLELSKPLFSRRQIEEKLATSESLAQERGAQVVALSKVVEGIATASPTKWETTHADFSEQFRPWAQNLCSHILTSTADTAAKVRREIEQPFRDELVKVLPVLDEAMNLLSSLKHDLYPLGKGDYNGKIPCCQEEGEECLHRIRAILGEDAP